MKKLLSERNDSGKISLPIVVFILILIAFYVTMAYVKREATSNIRKYTLENPNDPQLEGVPDYSILYKANEEK